MKIEIKEKIEALNLIAEFLSTNGDLAHSGGEIALETFSSFLTWKQDEGDLSDNLREIAFRIFSSSDILRAA